MGGSIVTVVVAVGLLVAALALRAGAGRLPRSLLVHYMPESGASVVDDAILAGRERRAAAAGLIDLVVRGRVRLLSDAGARRSGLAVQIVEPDALTHVDRQLLDTVCGPDTPSGLSRRLSADRRAIARRVRAFIDARARQLQQDGLVAGRHPGRAVVRWGAAIWLAVIVIALAASPGPADTGIVVLAGLVDVAALIVVPAGRARRWTAQSRERRAYLDGIDQYLRLAEAERLRVLQSPAGSRTAAADDATLFALNERLLPYALIFGVEKAWIALLAIGYDELGETSGTAVAGVGDTLAQVIDVGAAVDGLVDIVFALDHAVDAGGAVIDGLF